VPGSELMTFLLECMKENLNHARHVENEIHSFTGVYMAIVAGLLAFNFSLGDSELAIGLYFIMLCASAIAFFLIRRWYAVFDTHMRCAENVYHGLVDVHVNGKYPYPELDRIRQLQKSAGADRKVLVKQFISDDDLLPLYAFSHKRKHSWLRTRWLVYGFHFVICIVVFILFIRTIVLALLAL